MTGVGGAACSIARGLLNAGEYQDTSPHHQSLIPMLTETVELDQPGSPITDVTSVSSAHECYVFNMYCVLENGFLRRQVYDPTEATF